MKKCPKIKYELKANTKFPLQLIYKIQTIAKNLEHKISKPKMILGLFLGEP